MRALIIDDMLHDFVDGALANPNAQAIVEPLQRLLEHARDEGWVVVYSNDAHRPEDPEVRIWGEHAMAGTPGAEVISQLEPREGEIVSPKRVYGAFEGTGLDEQLKERGVDEVVITGQHTHICVRHPASERRDAGAREQRRAGGLALRLARARPHGRPDRKAGDLPVRDPLVRA